MASLFTAYDEHNSETYRTSYFLGGVFIKMFLIDTHLYTLIHTLTPTHTPIHIRVPWY